MVPTILSSKVNVGDSQKYLLVKFRVTRYHKKIHLPTKHLIALLLNVPGVSQQNLFKLSQLEAANARALFNNSSLQLRLRLQCR